MMPSNERETRGRYRIEQQSRALEPGMVLRIRPLDAFSVPVVK